MGRPIMVRRILSPSGDQARYPRSQGNVAILWGSVPSAFATSKSLSSAMANQLPSRDQAANCPSTSPRRRRAFSDLGQLFRLPEVSEGFKGRRNRESNHFRTILAAFRGLERCGLAPTLRMSCFSNVGKRTTWPGALRVPEMPHPTDPGQFRGCAVRSSGGP